jgi:hypothetical protein
MLFGMHFVTLLSLRVLIAGALCCCRAFGPSSMLMGYFNHHCSVRFMRTGHLAGTVFDVRGDVLRYPVFFFVVCLNS